MVKIGIVGGGQLGKMLLFEAKKMGFYVAILDPDPEAPAMSMADKKIIADFNDEKVIIQLAQDIDFLTFENEKTNGKFLDHLEKKVNCQINPLGKIWRLSQDKLCQKQLLKKYRLPTASFYEVVNLQQLKKIAQKVKFPFYLKARFNAYDGKGNYLIQSSKDIEIGWEKLKNEKPYVEEYVKFDKELSIIVARGKHNQMAFYPIVETIQQDNICHFVIVPAQISSSVTKKVIQIAYKTLNKVLKGNGVFNIEMFKTIDDQILINEFSPRVHNSGHYTIEACYTSQFEQHIRAICGFPLGSTKLKVPAAVMVNILGSRSGKAKLQGLEKVLSLEKVSVHLYGKKKAKHMRKMGHITVLGQTIKEAYQKAIVAKNYLSI